MNSLVDIVRDVQRELSAPRPIGVSRENEALQSQVPSRRRKAREGTSASNRLPEKRGGRALDGAGSQVSGRSRTNGDAGGGRPCVHRSDSRHGGEEKTRSNPRQNRPRARWKGEAQVADFWRITCPSLFPGGCFRAGEPLESTLLAAGIWPENYRRERRVYGRRGAR